MWRVFKYCFFFNVCISNITFAQVKFNQEYSFLQYLIQEQLYDEAFILGDDLLTKIDKTSQIDSISYRLAKLAQRTRQKELSTKYFEQISIKSSSYSEAAFRASYNYLELKDYLRSEAILSRITDFSDLKNIELAGISLLKRDYNNFLHLKHNLGSGEFSKTGLKLDEFYEKLQNTKKYSPFVAGLFSTFVPGLGKGYAGEWRQMWGSFLPELLLGLQTWEAYRKDGIQSARFIIYASLFTVFHIGNIWGSSFTARLKTTEYYDTIDQQIIFELKIPINKKF